MNLHANLKLIDILLKCFPYFAEKFENYMTVKQLTPAIIRPLVYLKGIFRVKLPEFVYLMDVLTVY